MINSIKTAVARLKTTSGNIHVISHHDTDGITSASILTRALQREERQFRVSIVKQLNKKKIEELLKEDSKILLFLDLGSKYLDRFKETSSTVFILDHHETEIKDIPPNVCFINPLSFHEEENICAAALTYMFAKEMNNVNMDLASLAVIGIINGSREAKSSKIGSEILKDASDVTIKRSILMFPATRPLHKALEFSNIFIPGITGSSEGVSRLLNDAGIKLKEEDAYRTLLDLNEEETSKLLNLICLRKDDETAFGNIYLVKFFNQLEDARELSTLINACGRMNQGSIALEMCLGSKRAKSQAETTYGAYKHSVISSLKLAASIEKIETENYVIINAGNRINDNILSVVVSIMASSFVYAPGKVIIGMADMGDGHMKISSRICGNATTNIELQGIIEPLLKAVDGEGGGNIRAAGGIIPLEKSQEFVDLVQKELNLVLKH